MSHLSRRDFLVSGAAATTALMLPTTVSAKAETLELPAKAVTKGPKHHWFGYYDKFPWYKSERYLLANENEFCDRQPEPGETITVGMVDLKSGDYIPLDTTPAWSWQQGTMLQWLGSQPETHIIYNSFTDKQPSSTIRNVESGKTQTLPRPIYALNNAGTQAVTLDFARLDKLRPGYGYCTYKKTNTDDPAPETAGIWNLDLASGKSDIIVTLKQLAGYKPDSRFTQSSYHWVNHLQFNPSGTRSIFLHRWKKDGDSGSWFTRLFTVKPDGTDLRLHLDTGMVSHFDWQDDNTILAWVKLPKGGQLAFALIDVNDNEVTPFMPKVLTRDGHCSYSPDRKWILNDTYPDGERMQTLMVIEVATQKRIDLNKFHSPKQFTGPVRCDLHPRWNRDGTMICFDGCHDPQRQVYVVDVKEVVG